MLFTIIGHLNFVVSLNCQLKIDEDNLLKLNIGRKINIVRTITTLSLTSTPNHSSLIIYLFNMVYDVRVQQVNTIGIMFTSGKFDFDT